MAHNLIINYGLYKKLEIHVSELFGSHFVMKGINIESLASKSSNDERDDQIPLGRLH